MRDPILPIFSRGDTETKLSRCDASAAGERACAFKGRGRAAHYVPGKKLRCPGHRDTTKECIRRNAPNAPMEPFRLDASGDFVLSEFDVVQPDIFYNSNRGISIMKEKNIQGMEDPCTSWCSPRFHTGGLRSSFRPTLRPARARQNCGLSSDGPCRPCLRFPGCSTCRGESKI